MTCRCTMCGGKNAGRCRSKRLYTSHGIGTDEHGHFWGGLTKQDARQLLRTRLTRETQKEVEDECETSK